MTHQRVVLVWGEETPARAEVSHVTRRHCIEISSNSAWRIRDLSKESLRVWSLLLKFRVTEVLISSGKWGHVGGVGELRLEREKGSGAEEMEGSILMKTSNSPLHSFLWGKWCVLLPGESTLSVSPNPKPIKLRVPAALTWPEMPAEGRAGELPCNFHGHLAWIVTHPGLLSSGGRQN